MPDWDAVIDTAFREALTGKSGAVPGAKFRNVVARVAEQMGIAFPPEDMGRFSDFLERFPEKILVQRIPGRDILVTPADEPERLSHERGVTSRLRSDLFVALTRFDQRIRYFYLVDTDQVSSFQEGVGDKPPVSAVQLPVASRDYELALRARFVQSEAIPQNSKEPLETSLTKSHPLPSFSEAVKRFGLSREWHMFRMADLVDRLRGWANDHDIPWNPSWLGGQPSVPDAPISAEKLQRDLGSLITALAGQVSEADLARISVPLDIVLRLLPTHKG